MDTSVAEDHPPKTARGFAALHRDVWRTVKIAPAIFIVLPAVGWFPMDVLIEATLSVMELDEWQELRYSLKFDRLAQWIFGSLILAVQMQALRIIAEGKHPRFGIAVRGGFEMWARMMGIFFSIAWRTSLALILLIVPGIYLMVRYSLAYPVAAFEDKHGSAALDASRDYVKGCGWKVFFVALGALCIYLPLTSVPFFLVADDAGPLLLAIAAVPINAVFPLFIVAMALLYADRRQDWFPAEPVGQRDPTGPMAIEVSSTGRSGVWLVAGLSFALTAFAVAAFIIGPEQLIAEADAAYERQDYELALAKYEEAAESYPDDPYIEYSLGWVHYDLGDLARAEQHMARAIELVPEGAYYLLGHASVLIDLGRFEEAGKEIDHAERLEDSDPETIEYLRTVLRESEQDAQRNEEDR